MDQRTQPPSHSFLKGALLLGVASFLSRLLGTLYKIPYENMTGPLGFYIYNQVYPLYSMLLTLSTAGFPTAVSKMVAERMVAGDLPGARRIYRISSLVLSGTGLFFFLLLFLGAPWLARWMGGGQELVLPIRSVSFSLLIVPMMAALRGYFQGQQNMWPTSVSQILEQVVRVCVILLLTYLAIQLIPDPHGAVVWAASGAVFGAFAGAVASLLFLLAYRKRKEGHLLARQSVPAPERAGTGEIIGQILRIALPIALGTLVLPLFNLVDVFTIKTILNFRLCGGSAACEQAAYLKGIYDRAPTLVQFASFFATAIALSIVPAVAESMARSDRFQAQRRASLALKTTLWISLPAATGLMVLAEPLNIMLFRTGEGAAAVAISSFTVLFSTLSITSTAILQGVGKLMRPARNLLIAMGFKALFNLLLVYPLGINGAALATALAYLVAAVLNILAVDKYLGITHLSRFSVLGSAWSALFMGFVVWLYQFLFLRMVPTAADSRGLVTLMSLTAVLLGMLVYAWSMLRTGTVRAADLNAIPRLGKWTPHLARWGLMRSAGRERREG